MNREITGRMDSRTSRTAVAPTISRTFVTLVAFGLSRPKILFIFESLTADTSGEAGSANQVKSNERERERTSQNEKEQRDVNVARNRDGTAKPNRQGCVPSAFG